MKIRKVTHKSFRKYGRIVEGIDFSPMIEAIRAMPGVDGVAYEPSVKELEDLPCTAAARDYCFGEMPVEVGYCIGHNDRLNGLEYHRNSEINVAVTDVVLLLGKLSDVDKNNQYDTAKVRAFFIPKGTAVELFATTLHYTPCGLKENGHVFGTGVILPYGTNFPTERKPRKGCREDRLYQAKNKWLIAHPDGGQGDAYVGLSGENICVDDLKRD